MNRINKDPMVFFMTINNDIRENFFGKSDRVFTLFYALSTFQRSFSLTWLFILFFILILVTPSGLLWAKTVSVPVTLNYPFLNQLLVLTVFDRPGKKAELTTRPEGCTKIILSEPRLAGLGSNLRLMTRVRAVIGIGSERNCTHLMGWEGKAEVIARPVIRPKPSQRVGFEVKDVKLYNQQGAPLTSGFIWNSIKGYLRTMLDPFWIDFGPSLYELKALLPLILPHHSADQMTQVINSLHLTRVEAGPEGVAVEMGFMLEMLSPQVKVPEPVLTTEEIARWEKQWESLDAFLTFVIKRMAASTASASLHTTLLEILLDTRYDFREALSSDAPHKEDPVRELFVRSWRRLAPLLQEVGATLTGREPLSILALITAGDALQVLDRIGPTVGLEISKDGLRRLARLMGESPGADPLRYVTEEDPELRKLFGFDAVPEEKSPSETLKLNFRLVRPAFAETSPQNPLARLNAWVPTIPELSQYLPMVRKLLEQKAHSLLKKVNIRSEVASVYQKLVLTASWQESCWRQYVLEKGKLVPLRSGTGDVGLMQINERVWRGFYAIHKLRWDIDYNAHAGSEILMKYLIDYALPKEEFKKGNPHDLARAAYSAYNGGPSQINRFRNPNPAPLHKKIDNAFWEKYQAVHRGEAYNVAECFGGTKMAVKTEPAQPVPPPKGPRPKGLKQENWIRAQNPKHFTLQIAALSTEKTMQEFANKLPNPEHAAFYRLNRDGRQFYVVIYGTFSERAQAEKAARLNGFDKPWIRDFASLHEIIKKK